MYLFNNILTLFGQVVLEKGIVNVLGFQENRNALKNVWMDATIPYIIDQTLGRFWMF